MTIENGETRKSAPRWLYGLLIASLAANLLVAGGAASAFWAHRHGHHGERGLIGFADRLPAERQGTIRQGLQAEREKLKPLREAVKTGWTETNEALGAEPFDKEKFKASLGRMNEAETRVRAAVTGALVDLADKLTPEERKSLKVWREHKGHFGERGWKKRHWGHERGKGNE